MGRGDAELRYSAGSGYVLCFASGETGFILLSFLSRFAWVRSLTRRNDVIRDWRKLGKKRFLLLPSPGVEDVRGPLKPFVRPSLHVQDGLDALRPIGQRQQRLDQLAYARVGQFIHAGNEKGRQH